MLQHLSRQELEAGMWGHEGCERAGPTRTDDFVAVRGIQVMGHRL